MFQQLFSLFNIPKTYYRRFIYAFTAFLVSISINLVQAQPSFGISWIDLIKSGIQVVQISNISKAQEVELGNRLIKS